MTAFARVNASECNINVRCLISSGGGSWHHIVVGADDRSLVLYVDGALADRRAIYDMKWDTPSMIENQLSGYRDDFSPVGIAVDDLRIYRRVLSADEVLNMYLGNAR